MKCPQCAAETGVTDSRWKTDNTTRRRRECVKCHHRFTSYESLGLDKVQLAKEIKRRIIITMLKAARETKLDDIL